jgi:hypothetical protein
MSNRNRLLSNTVLSGVGSAFLTTVTGQIAAADPAMSYAFDKMAYKAVAPNFAGPAVDGINGKIAGFGGAAAHRSIYGVEGSLSFPVGYSYGVQIDSRFGGFGSRGFGEIGAHFFWRNPGVGLAGLYVSHVRLDRFGTVHASTVAFEGEYYFGRWTIQGIAGVEFGDSGSSTTTVVGPVFTTSFTGGYDIKTRFFDQINLKYYFTDNWNGYVGHRYQGGKHALALGTEGVIPLTRSLTTTAFLEGRIGESDHHGIWGGLRYYFGKPDKTLIRRHREDDPYNWSTLFTILNSSGSLLQLRCTDPSETPVGGQCLPPNGSGET